MYTALGAPLLEFFSIITIHRATGSSANRRLLLIISIYPDTFNTKLITYKYNLFTLVSFLNEMFEEQFLLTCCSLYNRHSALYVNRMGHATRNSSVQL